MKCLKMSSLFLCWCFVLLSACSTEAPVLGKWESVETNQIGKTSMEFFKDKTCVLNESNSRLGCKWVALDDGRIKVDFANFGLNLVSFATIKADEMKIDGENKGVYLRNESATLRQAKSDLELKRKREQEARELQLKREQEQRELQLKREQEQRELQILINNRRKIIDDQRNKDIAMTQMLITALSKSYGEFINMMRKEADSGSVSASNQIAWIYATDYEPEYINPALAISYAETCVQKFPDMPEYFDTLAAAYARNGDFAKAIKNQELALDLMKNFAPYPYSYGDGESLQRHLELYKQGKPLIVSDLRIRSVSYSSEEAGLKPGEIIMAIDSVKVKYAFQFKTIINNSKRGDIISLLVRSSDAADASTRNVKVKVVQVWSDLTIGTDFDYIQ